MSMAVERQLNADSFHHADANSLGIADAILSSSLIS